RPVVYYLSEGFPTELEPGAYGMAADFNHAFQRAAAAAKGVTVEDFAAQYGDMYVLCHNPVDLSRDPDVCDPRPADERTTPFVARVGDLRRSFVYWVDNPQAAWPLGFGPSYTDPETGEIISGTAYVYGAAVDTYAQSSL